MKTTMIGGAVVLLLCAGGTRVEAQSVASSFDQLSVLVKPGDKISVVDVTGREAEGRIETLSRDTLTLVSKAGTRQLGEANVTKIRQRRSDSLQNGAIIGAAAGAGYGLALLALAASMDDGGGPIPIGVVTGMVVFTGIGAAAGAGIDALITPRQVIYEKPGGARNVSISPVFLRGRRGVRRRSNARGRLRVQAGEHARGSHFWRDDSSRRNRSLQHLCAFAWGVAGPKPASRTE
jgi:hypothetical protein